MPIPSFKVKSIRPVGGGHEVDCKMDVGNFMLKACYRKEVRGRAASTT